MGAIFDLEVKRGEVDFSFQSLTVVDLAPNLICHPEFNWYKAGVAVMQKHPELFIAERHNWEHRSREVLWYAPELIDYSRYCWQDRDWRDSRAWVLTIKNSPWLDAMGERSFILEV